MKIRILKRALYSILLMINTASLFAWGTPHHYISQTAVESLPKGQRELLKDQATPFIKRYCIYPDISHAKDAAPYIMPKAGLRLHMMGTREKNMEIFEFYLPRILKEFKNNKTEEAMRWYGALAHYLEDSSCPGHVAFGHQKVKPGTMRLIDLEFFECFMHVPKRLEKGTFHSRVDQGGFTLKQLKEAMKGYKPVLLGASIDEMILNLAEKHVRMNKKCAKCLIPMMMALCENDKDKFGKEGLIAAVEGSKLVADTLYTLLMLSSAKVTPEMPPSEVSLTDFTPASGTNFTWSRFNYHGRIMRNASGCFNDTKGVPATLQQVRLKLKMSDGTIKEYKEGFGTGVGTSYTFLVPAGLFKKFTVDVGSHAEIGTEGVAGFSILLDGKPVVETGNMKGTEPVKHLEVDLGQAKKLTLSTTGSGKSAKIHAVWGAPTLKK